MRIFYLIALILLINTSPRLYAVSQNIAMKHLSSDQFLNHFLYIPDAESKKYIPAEYAHQSGVIVKIPLNWFTIFDYYAKIIENIIAAGATPHIILDNPFQSGDFKTAYEEIQDFFFYDYNIDIEHTNIITVASNTIWTRDFAPVFTYINGNRTIINNNYFQDHPQDDLFPEKLSALWNEPLLYTDVSTEGGNFMTDGNGHCWQTRIVFEDNPLLNKNDMIEILEDYYGCRKVFFTEYIPDEETGHIDMFAKVINQDTIMVSLSSKNLGATHTEIAALKRIYNSFKKMKKRDNSHWNIVTIPMAFGYDHFDVRTYFSYTNSLIINDRVLVPVYGIAADWQALITYKKLFPNHEIVAVDSSEVITYGGAVHCTTMQVPPKKYQRCGNGIIDPGEQCEKNYFNGKTCRSFSFKKGTLSCNDNCKFDTSDCQ